MVHGSSGMDFATPNEYFGNPALPEQNFMYEPPFLDTQRPPLSFSNTLSDHHSHPHTTSAGSWTGEPPASSPERNPAEHFNPNGAPAKPSRTTGVHPPVLPLFKPQYNTVDGVTTRAPWLWNGKDYDTKAGAVHAFFLDHGYRTPQGTFFTMGQIQTGIDKYGKEHAPKNGPRGAWEPESDPLGGEDPGGSILYSSTLPSLTWSDTAVPAPTPAAGFPVHQNPFAYEAVPLGMNGQTGLDQGGFDDLHLQQFPMEPFSAMHYPTEARGDEEYYDPHQMGIMGIHPQHHQDFTSTLGQPLQHKINSNGVPLAGSASNVFRPDQRGHHASPPVFQQQLVEPLAFSPAVPAMNPPIPAPPHPAYAHELNMNSYVPPSGPALMQSYGTVPIQGSSRRPMPAQTSPEFLQAEKAARSARGGR
ncbi:hypothetical protein JCM11641_002756 [Rhodosporidiobolus odoratus]